MHHPDAEQVNWEMVHLRDWETGEPLDPNEICAERYCGSAA